MSVRLEESDNEVLGFLEKATGLSKSELIRMAIRTFYKNCLKDEELPKEIKKILLYKEVNQRIKEIKRLRWLRHAKGSCLGALKEVEDYLRKYRLGLLDSKSRDRNKKRYEALKKREEELLELIEKLERMEIEG